MGVTEIAHMKYLAWFILVFVAFFVFLAFHIPKILGGLEEDEKDLPQGGKMEKIKKGIFSGDWWKQLRDVIVRLAIGYCEVCGEAEVSFIDKSIGICEKCATKFPDAIRIEKKAYSANPEVF